VDVRREVRPRAAANLHEPVFGGLQFSVRDPNGYVLRFLQEAQAVRP
jgi:hypothetical protein